MSNENEVKSLIEEQGKLVESFRKEVVDKITTNEEKSKVYVDEKDAKMQTRFNEIEEKLNKFNRPNTQLKTEDEYKEEAKELKGLYDTYILKGEKKIDRKDLEKMKDLATKQYQKRLNKAAGDPVLSYTDASGGHLIPEFMYQTILNNFQEIDPMRSEADVVSITSNKIEFHTGFDASAGWEAESFTYNSGTAPDAADPAFTRKELSCNVLAGQIRLSLEALEDIPNIGSYVTERLGAKMAYTESYAFIKGSGSGQPQGFDTNTNQVLMAAQSNNVTMGSNTVFDYDEFFELQSKFKTGYQSNLKWYFNLDTLGKLRKVQDSQGNYLWAGALQGADQAHPATISGRPYVVLPSLADLAADSYSVYVGDMKQAYKIIQRVGMSVKRLDEFQYPDVLFIARMRIGGDLVLPEALGYMKGAS
tara:strand:- start:974 stop:2230 length:1257 start_codon:yes stop_codon:yes gene_type:complete